MVTQRFHYAPLSDHLGAAVTGIDLAAIAAAQDGAAVAELKQALAKHQVLQIAGQSLSPAAYVALARLFGPLHNRRREDNLDAEHITGHPDIKVITNARTPDGRRAGDGSASELLWHTDGSRQEQPQVYSFLYGRTAPANPPRTFWMNMVAVYRDLSAPMKAAIAGRRAIHSVLNRSSEPQDVLLSPTGGLSDRMTGPLHPLVRRHPETGCCALYLPIRRDAIVDGLSPDASADLIGRLWDIVGGAAAYWGTALRPDALMIWDNRTTVHRREAFDERDERVVHYLAAGTEVPIAA